MKCKICGIRKPRRYCPGVMGDICSVCCGTEREVTVNCPLDCLFLREARAHEKPVEIAPGSLPNADIEVPEGFLRSHNELLGAVGFALGEAVLASPSAVDSDVRDALDSLTRTYRTLSSGLYYDSHPTNPFAAGIYEKTQALLADYRKMAQEKSVTVRDAEILAILVVFQRIAITTDNGRPKGRAFIDLLHQQFPAERNGRAKDTPLITL